MRNSEQLSSGGSGNRSVLLACAKTKRKKVDRVRHSLIPAGKGTPTDEEIREVWRKHLAALAALSVA